MGDQISLQEAKLWLVLREGTTTTAQSLSDKTQIPRRTVGLHLKSWADKGLVLREPTYPPTYTLRTVRGHDYVKAMNRALVALASSGTG